jgi:hypothetical protein
VSWSPGGSKKNAGSWNYLGIIKTLVASQLLQEVAAVFKNVVAPDFIYKRGETQGFP